MTKNSKNIQVGDIVVVNMQYARFATVIDVRDEILVTTRGYMHTDKVVIVKKNEN